MTRIPSRLTRILTIALLATAAASCGGGGGGGGGDDNEPPGQTAQEDQFGAAFAAAFRAPANSEPATVNDGDIVPVSLTAEPVNIT